VRDLFVLPKPVVRAKGRQSTVVKCDANLLRVVTERVENSNPALEFSQKAALETALLEWLEGGKAAQPTTPYNLEDLRRAQV